VLDSPENRDPGAQRLIRYGIIGFGLHAVRRLMPGFTMATNSQVTALSRRDLTKARNSAAEYNVAHAFESPIDLCRCPGVDAVFVATPNSSHVNNVMIAIESGKPALCEKPMGVNRDECSRMVEAARQAQVILGVAHIFRFARSITSLRERVAAGQIGRPVLVRSEFSFPGRTHARLWLTDAAIAGGGPIADIGVHCLDALRYVLRDEIVTVAATTASDKFSGNVEAAAVLSLSFARGTLGSVLVSTRAEYRTPLEVVGEEGVLRADNAFSVSDPIEIELRRGARVVDREVVSNTDAYARQFDAFSAALEGGCQFPVPGEEGWQNQEVLDAAYRSARTGRTETVRIVERTK
jgi:predicted dehydrogenase